MKGSFIIVIGFFTAFSLMNSSCFSEHKEGEHSEKMSSPESSSEHTVESDEGESREGEESGTKMALDDTFDQVRNGVRLILNYDEERNSFEGILENTSDQRLDDIRVEVHLSNSMELGPTTRISLEPGEKSDVLLKASSKDFTGWEAHAEVGSSEEGHGEEDEEHEKREEGEHDEEGDGHN